MGAYVMCVVCVSPELTYYPDMQMVTVLASIFCDSPVYLPETIIKNNEKAAFGKNDYF